MALWVLLGAAVACDRDARAPARPRRLSPAEIARARARTAAATARPTARDAAAADEVDPAATTEAPAPPPGPVAACVARVSQATPPELATALDTLEYPAALEDACRLSLAVTTRDPALCDAVRLSAVRSACATRAAIATGTVEACPSHSLDRGRDPVCVALANRSPGLCAATAASETRRCIAIARGDATQCDALDPLLRPRCRGDVVALRGLLPPMRGAPLPAGTAHLRVVFGAPVPVDAGSPREAAFDGDVDLVARGAYMDPEGVAYLVDPQRGWPSSFASSLSSQRPVLGVAVALPRRPGPGTLADLRIVMPNGLVIEPRPGGQPAQVAITRVPTGRGGPLEGTASLETLVSGTMVRVELSFRTFVRDVLPAARLGHGDAPADE